MKSGSRGGGGGGGVRFLAGCVRRAGLARAGQAEANMQPLCAAGG